MTRRRKLLIALAIVAVVAIAARAALPFVVEYYANRTLAGLEGGYTGHVEDVDLAVWRGNYSLEGLRIDKREGDIPLPFASVPRLDVSIQWGALLRGALVAEVHAIEPRMVFVDAESKERSQTGMGPDWAEKLEALAPFRFNRVTVRDGRIEFRNFESEPPVEIYIDDIEVLAENLTNIRGENDDVFGTVSARGLVMGETPVSVDARIDPVADPPELELDAQLEKLPLPMLNPLLDAYANVDAEAGTFSVYVEIATAGGRFEGYVKPLLENAEFLSRSDDENIFRKAWEGIVDLVAEVFENQPKERVATRVPLSGELDAVEAELVPAIFNILRNAFVQALSASISDTVSLEDVDESFRNEDQDGQEDDTG
ncbi:MAG TPA: DUF748 domain-containing protein [Gammaproteobacteria bacterium]|nr:DUF748 domain-containing protein [Gammaproteobacteria bacterium]